MSAQLHEKDFCVSFMLKLFGTAAEHNQIFYFLIHAVFNTIFHMCSQEVYNSDSLLIPN
jgi:hypothetical protein